MKLLNNVALKIQPDWNETVSSDKSFYNEFGQLDLQAEFNYNDFF